MLVSFTDSTTGSTVAVNPKFVVAVFTAPDGDNEGQTVIGLINGNLVVNDSYLEVIGQLQGELK
jgi:uncharacterized protein YlzI (FlbEa/FlbD family)